jgi:hypothetical protein
MGGGSYDVVSEHDDAALVSIVRQFPFEYNLVKVLSEPHKDRVVRRGQNERTLENNLGQMIAVEDITVGAMNIVTRRMTTEQRVYTIDSASYNPDWMGRNVTAYQQTFTDHTGVTFERTIIKYGFWTPKTVEGAWLRK